jgi:hypothetical protein
MSDEPGGAGPSNGWLPCRYPDFSFDPDDPGWLDFETVAVATGAVIYLKAFLEELGKRTGEGMADLPKKLADHIRVFREARKGKPDEFYVGFRDDPEAAMIVVTEDLPDEGRLALLDLDVTAEALRGKTLRWDATAGAWLPDDKG